MCKSTLRWSSGGLLIEKQKLNTAGGCVEEEKFHFAKWFLHLIQVGRCENEWVRPWFLTKQGYYCWPLPQARVDFNLIFFSCNLPISTGRLWYFVLAFFFKALKLFYLLFIASTSIRHPFWCAEAVSTVIWKKCRGPLVGKLLFKGAPEGMKEVL